MNGLEAIPDNPKVLVIGAHKPIIQSILDFDYLSGKTEPSIAGIVTASARYLKFFWGPKEKLIPCFKTAAQAAKSLSSVDLMFNISSGRRTLQSTDEFFAAFPDALGGHTFAEDTPEQHAIDIYEKYQKNGKFLIGPAGVGLLIAGKLKLGAIGGTDYRQITNNHLATAGSVAVLSASGGMINEIITMVNHVGKRVSFALCFGGDRFPYTTPAEAFLMAENDPATETIVYYGELGGTDEYEICELLNEGKITKPVIAYIAGVIGETFEQPVQFGHAKALARTNDETASAKRKALASAGAQVANSIADFVSLIEKVEASPVSDNDIDTNELENRKPTLFSSTISKETDEGYAFVGRTLTDWAEEGSFVKMIVSGLLGREPKSELMVKFTRMVFMLGLDHGPNVAGAVNTMITARAGKNLVDSLAAGLLTVGPRFGGAISGAAETWFKAVQDGVEPAKLVEDYASQKRYVMGIGHKKYRLGLPDPRTEVLRQTAESLKSHPYLDFASAVEEITTAKKANLILNFDGTIAALLLDILEQEEGLSPEEISLLIEADFFNAFFVIPRAIGFTSHFLDQKRLDEGLFRLPDNLVSE